MKFLLILAMSNGQGIELLKGIVSSSVQDTDSKTSIWNGVISIKLYLERVKNLLNIYWLGIFTSKPLLSKSELNPLLQRFKSFIRALPSIHKAYCLSIDLDTV